MIGDTLTAAPSKGPNLNRKSVLYPFRPPADWMDEGACAAEGVDPRLFDTSEQPRVLHASGEANEEKKYGAARLICKGCPVAKKCLDYALEWKEPDGIWAGTTPRQRRSIKAMATIDAKAAAQHQQVGAA